jgi:hypothetical protein
VGSAKHQENIPVSPPLSLPTPSNGPVLIISALLTNPPHSQSQSNAIAARLAMQIHITHIYRSQQRLSYRRILDGDCSRSTHLSTRHTRRQSGQRNTYLLLLHPHRLSQNGSRSHARAHPSCFVSMFEVVGGDDPGVASGRFWETGREALLRVDL